MSNNNDYKATFRIVKNVINDLDLLGLLKNGVPNDEYEDEIAKIVARLNHYKDVKSLQEEIYIIFKESFGVDSAGNLDSYYETARRIVKDLGLK